MYVCSSRQGLRVHYPSQTAAPSRGFPDFLLRAPAASVAQPESGSTTEVSESEEEEEGREGDEGGPTAAGQPGPTPSTNPHLNTSIQHTQAQETGSTSESNQNPLNQVLNDLQAFYSFRVL